MQWSCLGSVLLFGLDARPSWAGSSRRHCLQGPCPPGSGTPNAKQPVVLSESGWRRHRHHLPSAISQNERLFVVVAHFKAAVRSPAVPGRSGSGHGRLCRIESGLAENRSWVRSPAVPTRRKLCARAPGSGGAAETHRQGVLVADAPESGFGRKAAEALHGSRAERGRRMRLAPGQPPGNAFRGWALLLRPYCRRRSAYPPGTDAEHVSKSAPHPKPECDGVLAAPVVTDG